MKPVLWYHPVSGRIRFEGPLPPSWIPLYGEKDVSPWKPTSELQFVRKTRTDGDHTYIHSRPLNILQQKWIREGFKDGETYVIETEWRDVPEVV